MIRSFDRSYSGINRYLRGLQASASSEPTPLMARDFLSHDRISFLPLRFAMRTLIESAT